MIRLLVHCANATPGLFLIFGWYQNRLGVDPEKTLIWESGIWAFNLLLVVVLMPVAAGWARWPALYRYRRAIGLWAFVYATSHFLFFIIFLLGWDLKQLGEELRERPYILAGFGAWLILFIMALTSNRTAMVRFGRKWRTLHLWVYGAIGLAAVHYLLMIRSDYGWPGVYALIVILVIVNKLLRRKNNSPHDA